MDAKPCLNLVNDPLLRPIIAARILGISRSTLQHMARERRVPGLKIGRLWRFRQGDLESWIESKVNVKDVKAGL